ncbi:MAG: fibronectin type III domain-containing protein [FCB group bacterium]|nr:fibronectin type III domain-containing protein [FCB group bacterium]
MKTTFARILIMVVMALTGMFLIGCEDDKDTIVYVAEDGPPPVPQGVYSITGDDEVLVEWLPIDDVAGDFAFYVVYRSDSDPDTGYWAIGETTNEYLIDDDVVNGHTYYYAVSSVDDDGNLSDLSYEYVLDTPRPQGSNRTLYDFVDMPSFSGWYFAGEAVVSWDHQFCDLYLEYVPGDGVYYFNVGDENTDIQDMGYTDHLDEIDYSPKNGWSANGWSEVILGHTYIFWTADNHFAKIRVTGISLSGVTFDWAYQVDTGNRELKPLVPRAVDYLRRVPGQPPVALFPGDAT